LQNGYLAISPKCTAWRSEASGYIWNDKAADDSPVKENDHLMDATRYFVKTMNIIRKSRRKDLNAYDYVADVAGRWNGRKQAY
jgi:hypothetical protein